MDKATKEILEYSQKRELRDENGHIRKYDDQGRIISGRGSEITERQQTFLRNFIATYDVGKSLKAAGMDKYDLNCALRREGTAFSKAFKDMSKKIEQDFSFSKGMMLTTLLRMLETAESGQQVVTVDEEGISTTAEAEPNLKMMLDIIKEINRMQDGHIAAQRKEVVKTDTFRTVVDLSKPRAANIEPDDEANIMELGDGT